MANPRDGPFVDEVDLMIAWAGLYDAGGSSMYNGGRRTYKQKEDWRYVFPKKGETMADGEVIIPVQDWDASVKCPKCEGDNDALKIKWKDRGTCVVNDCETSFPDGFEYLFVHCDKCGFEFLMQTSDADERAKALKEAQEEKEEEEEEEDEDKAAPAQGHGRRVVKGGA
jgi:hypothetical protein